MMAFKYWQYYLDKVLVYLLQCFINCCFFWLEFSYEFFDVVYLEWVKQVVLDWSELDFCVLEYFFIQGVEVNVVYCKSKDEIKILCKNGQVCFMLESIDYDI